MRSLRSGIGAIIPGKDVFSAIFLLLVSVLLYVATIKGVYGNVTGGQIKNNLDQVTKPLELSPERGRFILTLSLAQNKSFALSKQLADAAFPDVGYYNGRFYVYFAPGISMLSLPLYLLGTHYNLSQVFAFFTLSIFATLTILLIYKIARDIFKLPIWASLLSSIVFAFGSTAWSYSVTMYEHLATAFFLTSTFYAAWRYSKQTGWGWLWALYIWFAYAASIFVDYPNAVLLLPVIVYFLISSLRLVKKQTVISFSLRPAIIITSIVFIVLAVVHGYYNYTNFGAWNRLSGTLVGYKAIRDQHVSVSNKTDQQLQNLTEKKSAVGFFKEENLPNGIYILLFSPDRGLFLYSPIFILAVLGILTVAGSITWEIGTLLAVICVNLFLYSSFGDPWGGWAFGPRYLIPSMTILSLFLGIFVSQNKFSIARKLITLILFAYSSAVALVGVLTTNDIPPKSEADFLHTKHTFLLNFDYLREGKTSSFLFQHILTSKLTLTEYFMIIYVFLILVVFCILFVLPIFNRHEH